MDTRPVIAAVDGSDHSLKALTWAAQAAQRLGAELVVAHVLPDHAQIWAARSEALGHRPEIETEDPVVSAVREWLAARGVRGARYASLEGDVPDALRAQGEEARMLVMGSRGRGGFASLLLGSNSRAVATSAACPVVVVPHEDRTVSPEGPDGTGDVAGDRVALGLDPGETADAVVEFAFAEAAAQQLPLHVLSACPVPPVAPTLLVGSPLDASALETAYGDTGAALLEEDTRRAQDERLRPFVERHPEVTVQAATVPADAAGHLVDASERASLVVVGRHRHRLRPGSLLMGSVAHAVLHHARCPVAVVPAAEGGSA